MSPLARLLRSLGAIAAALALAVSLPPLAAQSAEAKARQAEAHARAQIPRVTYKLPGGVTVEERGTYPREVGVRGPDGQMLIEFGLYSFIWTPPGVGKTILEVRRQSTGSAPRQELRGLYDFAERRFVLPCEYSDYRALGAAYLVTRRELKPKTPDKTFQGIYDPAVNRETFPCEAIRVFEHQKKLIVLTSLKETAVFDSTGREVEPRRYTTVDSDAKLPVWRVQLARGAAAPYGYISATTGKALTPVHYARADGFLGGAARVMRDGRYTFIDATGREPRPEGYAFLTSFRDGVAAFARQATVPASYFDRVRGAGWGFVTVAGEESAAAYEDVGHDVYGPLLQEGRVLVKHAGRWLAVDPRLPQAEAIAAAAPVRWEVFSAPGQTAGPWGFRIPGGDTMLAPKWQYLGPFLGAYAPFGVKQKLSFDGGKTKREVVLYGLIDATGREILPPRYAGIKGFDEHHAQVMEFPPNNGPRFLHGLLDLRTLQVVVPPRYDWELLPAGEGVAALRAGLGATWRLIDFTGRELTPVYNAMSTFKEGMLKVQQGRSWFWLDRDFQPVHADKNYAKIEEFANGGAMVWTGQPDQYGRYRGQARINHAGQVLQTFADATGAPQPTGTPVARCGACNGTGKQFREVKVEYGGAVGSALRPYTPGGGYTSYSGGSYSKWEHVGACTACGGKGTVQPFKKK